MTNITDTRVVIVAAVIRVFIFNFLIIITWLFDGIPNISSTFLLRQRLLILKVVKDDLHECWSQFTIRILWAKCLGIHITYVFFFLLGGTLALLSALCGYMRVNLAFFFAITEFSLILIVPLPPLGPVLHLLDVLYAITAGFLVFFGKVWGWVNRYVISPLLTLLTPVVNWIFRRYITAKNVARVLVRLTKTIIERYFPSFLSEILFWLGESILAPPIFWARKIYLFVNGPLRLAHRIFIRVHGIYMNDSNDRVNTCTRYIIKVLLTGTALIIALPSPVSLLNYFVTGYGYPGSTISKCMFSGSWTITMNIKTQIGPWYNTWLMGYARMLIVGLVTPFVLPFQCMWQVINNTLCPVSHIAFLAILNGHKRSNFFLVYYGICSIIVHMESVLVALVATLHSLRVSVNDHVSLMLCMIELYLVLNVSWKTCKLTWRKIKSPNEDVLWETCSHSE